eukprot:s746_g24.t5
MASPSLQLRVQWAISGELIAEVRLSATDHTAELLAVATGREAISHDRSAVFLAAPAWPVMLHIKRLSGEEVTSVYLTELSDVKALKQRLHQQHGLPPRFRQRLLHKSSTLDDALSFASFFDPRVVAATFSEATEEMPRQLAAAAEHGSASGGALKRRSDPEDVARPPCRQRLLHDRHTLDYVELQVVIVSSSEASVEQRQELYEAIADGLVAEARCSLLTTKSLRILKDCLNKYTEFFMVEALLQLPIVPNMWDDDGYTPLIQASKKGDVDIVKLLLEAGALKDCRDDYGRTALANAAMKGHSPVVKLLLEAGADKELQSNAGRTALSCAAASGQAASVQTLLEAGTRKDEGDTWGRTALMRAAEQGHASVVQLLLEARAKTDLRNMRGCTALMNAAERGHAATVQLLLEAAADKHVRNKRGETALMMTSNPEVRKQLHIEGVQLIAHGRLICEGSEHLSDAGLADGDVVNVVRHHEVSEGRPRTVAVWQDGQIKQWSTTRGLEAHRFQTSPVRVPVNVFLRASRILG